MLPTTVCPAPSARDTIATIPDGLNRDDLAALIGFCRDRLWEAKVHAHRSESALSAIPSPTVSAVEGMWLVVNAAQTSLKEADLLRLLKRTYDRPRPTSFDSDANPTAGLILALIVFASTYDNHPDYRPAWKPETRTMTQFPRPTVLR